MFHIPLFSFVVFVSKRVKFMSPIFFMYFNLSVFSCIMKGYVYIPLSKCTNFPISIKFP